MSRKSNEPIKEPKFMKWWSNLQDAIDHAKFWLTMKDIEKFFVVELGYPSGVEYRILTKQEWPFVNSRFVKAIVTTEIIEMALETNKRLKQPA